MGDRPELSSRSFTAWPAWADLPLDVVVYGPDMPTEADLRLLGHVSGKRVLELGCGGGPAAVALARQGAKVIAVDPSVEQIGHARRLSEREDVTVEWPEQLSPYVTVARLHVPRQDISGPANAAKSDTLAYNQWRVTDEHRPLGEIMHVRRIYTASAKVRRTLNHQPQTEPASADEVLP